MCWFWGTRPWSGRGWIAQYSRYILLQRHPSSNTPSKPCGTLQQEDLPQIRSILPRDDEVAAVEIAKRTALKEHAAKVAAVAAAAGGGGGGSSGRRVRATSSSSDSGLSEGALVAPRLGVVEAAFEALGGVRMLMAKMRACEFK